MNAEFAQTSYRLFKQWCCLNCGKVILHEIPICRSCFQFLKVSEKRSQRKVQTVPLYSLFNWNPWESNTLSNLILYLKTQPPEAWLAWQQMLKQRFVGIVGPDSVLLSCPSRSTDRLHAQHFTEVLGQSFSCEWSGSLEYISKQKTLTHMQKSRIDRIRVSAMKLRDALPRTYRTRELIFVDDVITTGSTFRQAAMAISPLKFSAIITFANRTHLATKTAI